MAQWVTSWPSGRIQCRCNWVTLVGLAASGPRAASARENHLTQHLQECRQASERRDSAMPSYEYECKQCGRKFEAMQSFEEHDRHEDHDRHQPLQCPKCGSRKVEQ